jgi:hypothetical protein
MMRKPKTSESCSKDSDFDCILRNTDQAFFWRPLTSPHILLSANSVRQLVTMVWISVSVATRRVRPAGPVTVSVGFLIDVLEGQFLQLLAHVLHAHAAGQRRIDIHRFFGDAGALLRRHMLERTHVVQPVGELDQEHPHVIGNREQKLAQVLGLLGALGDKIELLDLGQPVDETPDILAEQLLDFRPRGRSVLDRIVQQADRDGGFIEPHVGQDGGDFERVGDIGVAARTRLLAMLLHGVDISLVQQSLVDIGLVFLHALDELVLTHHLEAALQKRKCAESNDRRIQSISCLSAIRTQACPDSPQIADQQPDA